MIESDLFEFLPTSLEKEIFLHDLLRDIPSAKELHDLFSFSSLQKKRKRKGERERESTVNNNKRAIKQERLNQPPTCATYSQHQQARTQAFLNTTNFRIVCHNYLNETSIRWIIFAAA